MSSIFIAARHGSYDNDLNLSERGKKQMEQLAVAVQEVINESGLQAFLLCSTASRAEQGARILISTLGISEDRVIFHDCLYVDNCNPGDWEAIKELVEKFLQDGALVVLLSHLDVVSGIARVVARRFNVEKITKITSDVEYGQGWVVTQKDVSLVPKV